MCYEFSLFSNLSRVARFYIDGVSGSEKYAVASAVSRTSGRRLDIYLFSPWIIRQNPLKSSLQKLDIGLT